MEFANSEAMFHRVHLYVSRDLKTPADMTGIFKARHVVLIKSMLNNVSMNAHLTFLNIF